MVEFEGRRHCLPVSKLRPFNVRCDVVQCDVISFIDADLFETDDTVSRNCVCTSIIVDEDQSFGSVEYIDLPLNNVDIELPSKRIPEGKLSHLNDEQRAQLLNLLDEFCDLFTDKPGYCNLYEHEINVTPDFKPKRLKEYQTDREPIINSVGSRVG